MKKSTKSPKKSPKVDEGFIATPPTDEQIKKLKQLSDSIVSFLKQENSKPTNNLIDISKAYIKNLKKVFRDLWCEYREGQKHNDGNLITSSSTKMSQQAEITLSQIQEFYRSSSDYYNTIFSRNLDLPLEQTLFPLITELLRKIVEVYLDCLDELIKNAKTTQNVTLIPGFKTHELNSFEQISLSILELQGKYYQNGKATLNDYEEFQKANAEEEEEINESKSKSETAKTEKMISQERFENQKQAVEELRQFYKDIQQYILTRIVKLSKSREPPKGEEPLNAVPQLMNIATNFFKQIRILYPERGEEEDIPEEGENFISEEYQLFAENFNTLINGLWHSSHDLDVIEEFECFSKLLIDFVQEDMEQFDKHYFSLTQLGELFLEAYDMQDKTSCDDLYELILVQLQKREEEIEDAVKEEVEHLSNGITEDESSTQTDSESTISKKRRKSSKRMIDPAIERYITVAKRKNSKVSKLSSEFFDVYFKIQMKLGSKVPEDDDSELDEEEAINEYSDIYNHVAAILYTHTAFVDGQLQGLKSQKPLKNGDIVKRAKSVKGDSVSVSARSRVTVQTDASTTILQNQIYNAQTRVLHYALLTTYDLLIQANRNQLFLLIMKLSMRNKEDVNEVMKLANNLKDYTFDYIKSLNQAKQEANEECDIEYMEELEQRSLSLTESPQELYDSFTKSFQDAAERIITKYTIYMARQDEKQIIAEEELDQQTLKMWEEKRKYHIEQLTLLEKKYLIKEENEKQRSVPEAEKLLEEAKKYAAAKDFKRAKETKEKALDLEDEIIEKRISANSEELKKEREILLEKQSQELDQIQVNNEKQKSQKMKKYIERKQMLKNSLVPQLKVQANQIIEIACSCMALITGSSDKLAKGKKQAKDNDLKNDLSKAFNKVIDTLLEKYEINAVEQ